MAGPSTAGAFEDFGGGWSSLPLRSGSFGTFKVAHLRNTTGSPIRLVAARPVFAEGIEVVRIDVSRLGPEVPLVVADRHPPNALPAPGFVIPPSRGGEHELFALTIELRLVAPAVEGVLVGIDLRYEALGREETQRFLTTSQVCELPPSVELSVGCPATYQGIDASVVPPDVLLERLRDGTG